jgi:hypothetical protein
MRAIVVIALVLAAAPAIAADHSLVCKNPGHAYNITYSDGAKVAIVNPDSEAIHEKVIAASSNMVVLDIGKDGMASILHLDAPRKNEIFADGELVQTDACI